MQSAAVVEILTETEATRPVLKGGALVYVDLPYNMAPRTWRVSIVHPKALDVQHVLRGLPHTQPTRVEKGSRVHLTFEFENPKGRTYEPMAPPEEKGPYLAFSSWNSWSSAAASYHRRVQEQLRNVPEASLEPLLFEDTASQEETVDRLLKRLHEEVQYTSVSFGEAAIIPRSPDETLQRKYGDCKDKSTLLVALLHEKGIEAQLALLRAGDSREIETELGGLTGFDHVVVYVPALDQWIDPSFEWARAGQLPRQAEGRQALIVGPTTSGLVHTPKRSARENRVFRKLVYRLGERGGMEIEEQSTAFGSPEQAMRGAFSLVQPEQHNRMIENRYKHFLSPTVALEPISVSTTPLHDLERPFEVAARLTIQPTPGSEDREEISIPVPLRELLSQLPYFPRADDRETDYVLAEPSSSELVMEISPPPGYRPRPLPESIMKDFGIGMFQGDFQLGENNAVNVVCKLELRRTRLSPKEAESVADTIAELRKSSIEIAFDLAPELDLKAGRIREAIRQYQQGVDRSQEKALPRIRLARTLLKAGFGESAREEAHRAADLEPDLVLAHRTLALTLEHDLIGQHFHKGFDYENAVKARKHALTLAPHLARLHGDVAYLLEHSPDGVRYGAGSHLDVRVLARSSLNRGRRWLASRLSRRS
jgi:transglutaminase-like putative cysteine protease